MKKKIFFIIILVFYQISSLFAQKIVATVNFDLQYLQQEAKDLVVNLQSQLEEYVNGYDYAENKLGLVIPVRINIIFESYSQSAGNTEFKAQFLISSPSGENFYDRNWRFPYNQNEIIIHDETKAHPITSLIDYYIYLVLGGEMDTYELLGGTDYYEIARNILSRARSLGSEWSIREKDFQELTDGRLLSLREAKYYYYKSLFLIDVAEGKDVESIRKYNAIFMEKFLDSYNQSPTAKPIKRFLDYHFEEFCKLFSFEETPKYMEQLISIDPIHKKTYQKCIEDNF